MVPWPGLNRVNKLLLISYNFPPINSAGVFRVATFAGHLCRRGWKITVITVRGSSTETRDPRLMDLVPGDVRVIRTACPEFNRIVRRLKPPARPQTPNPAPVGPDAGTVTRRKRRGPVAALARLVTRVLTFPDKQVGWFFPLMWNTARMLRRERPTAVLSTSPPHSSHLPLMVLRTFMHFRWVVDFRDPWTAPRRISLGGAFNLQRFIEGRVLQRADAIIANTAGNRDVLLETFPGLSPEKISVITNGFDVSRFEDVLSAAAPQSGSRRTGSSCDLVYVGSVYPEMLDLYIAAMRELREQGRPLPRLRIYGVFETPQEQAKVAASGLEDAIEYAGRVPYEESLRVIAGAPALVLLLPAGERHLHWVPSKLYPYLFSRRPILAIVPPGDAARIVDATGSGMVLSSPSASEVASGIEEFLRRVDRDDFSATRNEDAINAYRTERLVDQLDDVLRSCPV